MLRLLTAPRERSLVVCGCKTNQGTFYRYFDAVVLLSAPLEVILERVAARSDNPYGKSAAERAEIAHYLQTVQPLLRRGATLDLDTSTLTVAEVADHLMALTLTA